MRARVGLWFSTSVLVTLSLGCGAGDDAPIASMPDATPDVSAPRDVVTVRDVITARDVSAVPDVPAVDVRPVSDVPVVDDTSDLTPDLRPDGSVAVDAEAPMPTVGATMRVTATSLNLRSGAGTSNSIITSMPCGTTVTVIGGPTTGWWNIRYGTMTGWASGAYLVLASAFDPSICGGTTTTPTPSATPEVSAIFELARSGVGYSYYWGERHEGREGLTEGVGHDARLARRGGLEEERRNANGRPSPSARSVSQAGISRRGGTRRSAGRRSSRRSGS